MTSMCAALRINWKMAGAAVLVGVASMSGKAVAAPVLFGTSYYEYVAADGISWADANALAGASSYLGSGGYLATVTSAAENAFLASLVSPFASFAGSWLGGEVVGGNSTWLVGPEAGQAFTYTNWGGIEPNNPPSKAYMNIGVLFAGIGNGQWADSAGGLSRSADPIQGYFVEYQVSAVPLPAALPLLGTALIGLGYAGRRKRRPA